MKDGQSQDILEIKTTIFKENELYPSKAYINHQLQLALCISLRGLDKGYLCLCRYLKEKKNDETINITGSLTQKDIDTDWKQEKIFCWLNQKEYIYECRILEHWDNKSLSYNKISLFRIQINQEYFLNMMREIINYFVNAQYSKSSQMSPKQMTEMINYIEKVDII